MQFTFDRDAMIKEISIAQEVISSKSAVTILSNILITAEDNALTIKASDSVVRFESKIPVDVQEEGSTTVLCDKFFNILASLPPGEVEFIQEDIECTIKPTAKRFKAKIKSQKSEKFPETESTENVPFFEVPASEFKEMIKQTIFAVSVDKNRFFMNGCYLAKEGDEIVMVATDGRRLSRDGKKGLPIPDFQPAIIPTKILHLVLKHAPDEGNIKLSIIDKSIFFKFANMEFVSNLIEADYPNYKRVIPDGLNNSFTVNKSDLEQAVKRTTVMIDKATYRIILKIKPGELEIICPESESGEANEVIPCRYNGTPASLALNYNFMIDPLKVIDTEDLVVEFFLKDAAEGEEVSISNPVIMKGSNNVDYLHVVMPMTY